ncbi:type 1 glutamine amidotransferase [Alicyclobacillus fructus]|uniref:type 1 glutamine amidotransferase n=1 Tax=Alicyclobacillus fructus TaxID=2816082 RepID=UPI001A909AF7|nr:glutamine amidotransferase [Alicyclobacillus fructus]
MSRKALCIAHLYPDLLNLYADRGNITVLRRRLEWRGYDVDVVRVTHGEVPDFSRYHLVLLGGGSDREQAIVADKLRGCKAEFQSAVQDGLPVLAICGGYQLLGEFYQLPSGEKVPGLALVDMVTEAMPDAPRLIGNIAVWSEEVGVIVGFENHGGRTRHGHRPLGRVLHGHGNDGVSGEEGLRHLRIWGTYVHGPLLPKNPALADAVLRDALAYAHLPDELEPLDDRLEREARAAFAALRMADVAPMLRSEAGSP